MFICGHLYEPLFVAVVIKQTTQSVQISYPSHNQVVLTVWARNVYIYIYFSSTSASAASLLNLEVCVLSEILVLELGHFLFAETQRGNKAVVCGLGQETLTAPCSYLRIGIGSELRPPILKRRVRLWFSRGIEGGHFQLGEETRLLVTVHGFQERELQNKFLQPWCSYHAYCFYLIFF